MRLKEEFYLPKVERLDSRDWDEFEIQWQDHVSRLVLHKKVLSDDVFCNAFNQNIFMLSFGTWRICLLLVIQFVSYPNLELVQRFHNGFNGKRDLDFRDERTG